MKINNNNILLSVGFLAFTTMSSSAALIELVDTQTEFADNASITRVFTVTDTADIQDINFTINFAKHDGEAFIAEADALPTGGAFLPELSITLEHGGVTVNLIAFGTFQGGNEFRGTIVFDDEATNGVADDPLVILAGSVTGVNPLSAFDGVSAVGDYTLTLTDDTAQDGISYYSSSLTLTTVSAVPEPSSTALLGLGGLAAIMRRRR